MAMNNGVLRPRDHVGSRALFDGLVRDGAIVRVLPGTFVDATLLTQRSTRFAAALAATTGSVLWGEDAAAALTGALDDRPFAANDQVMLAHPQGRRPLPGVLWVRRRVPDDRRVRVRGLRCPSAAYLAVEASARDDGALIERLLRERLMTPSDLVDVLGCFVATPGQQVRRRVVRASLDNPWSGGERHLQQLLRRNRIGGWVANHELVVDGPVLLPRSVLRLASARGGVRRFPGAQSSGGVRDGSSAAERPSAGRLPGAEVHLEAAEERSRRHCSPAARSACARNDDRSAPWSRLSRRESPRSVVI